MDDLMARTMVENLSYGLNPITGKALPYGDVCRDEVVQEALRMVLEHCTLDSYGTVITKKYEAKKQAKIERRSRYPEAGSRWKEEDKRLIVELYNKGYTVPHIANIVNRTPRGVGNQLEKLGVIKKNRR